MSLWNGANIPDLGGKTAVITGANSGIGYYTALELAKAGARVILACRNKAKGEAAAARINQDLPASRQTPRAIFMALDLADFASIREFASTCKESHATLDLLINNAGVMALPKRQTTAQGLEMQLGVNFIGHFLLTALLLPALMRAPAARVIQVSSIAHRPGRINFDDPMGEKSYKPWPAYQQSKLACLIFAKELARRAQAGGWGVLSLAAHPGVAATELVANGLGQRSLENIATKIFQPLIMQSGAAGAWPLILAAIDPDAKPGAYYGPQGWREARGRPGLAVAKPQALDPATGIKLWDLAESLTGTALSPGP